jgi:phage host-nuclease inhibitor protein Gam
MGRERKKVINNVTLEQATTASESYSNAHVKQMKLEAKMNEEINKVKSKYTDDLDKLTEEKTEHFETLQVYAQEQKDTWGKKKSTELLHTVIGFRTGTPKVVKDKKFTWDGITEIVSKVFPNLIRTKSELDKEAVIAISKSEFEFKDIKDKCYIDVVQDETFYVEPKLEEVV